MVGSRMTWGFEFMFGMFYMVQDDLGFGMV